MNELSNGFRLVIDAVVPIETDDPHRRLNADSEVKAVRADAVAKTCCYRRTPRVSKDDLTGDSVLHGAVDHQECELDFVLNVTASGIRACLRRSSSDAHS